MPPSTAAPATASAVVVVLRGLLMAHKGKERAASAGLLDVSPPQPRAQLVVLPCLSANSRTLS